MLRPLAKALVFFLLFANLSWVAHAGILAAGGGSCESMAAAVPNDDMPEAAASGHFKVVHDGVCDHSCHGGAHFVGMTPGSFSPSRLYTAAAPGSHGIHLYSRDSEPPLPPPNIRFS